MQKIEAKKKHLAFMFLMVKTWGFCLFVCVSSIMCSCSLGCSSMLEPPWKIPGWGLSKLNETKAALHEAGLGQVYGKEAASSMAIAELHTQLEFGLFTFSLILHWFKFHGGPSQPL